MSLPQALNFVLNAEGSELTEDPNDPGGLTRYGIALREHPELTADDIRNMTAGQAGQIYADKYWPARADELPDFLSIPLLASAVLQGPQTAVEILQAALVVDPDGSIGAQTIAAARLTSAKTLMPRYCAEQVRHLMKGAAWPTAGPGWIQRIVSATLAGVIP